MSVTRTRAQDPAARPARRKFSIEFLPMSRTDAALETLLACRPLMDGPRIALMKEVRARWPAAELRASIFGHLATEARSELADMWIVRSPADFDPAMPEFVTAGSHSVRAFRSEVARTSSWT